MREPEGKERALMDAPTAPPGAGGGPVGLAGPAERSASTTGTWDLRRSVLSRVSVLWRGDRGIPLILVAVALVTATVSPRFATFSNLQNVARQMSVLIVFGVAAALPILGGGLDLSIAACAAGAGVVLGLTWPDHGLVLGLAFALAFGTAVGAVNGWVIARFDASPFIVTLGSASAIRGIALVVTDGRPIYDFPEPLVASLGYGAVGPIPIPVLWACAVLAVTSVLLRRLKFGRYLYAIGGNERAAFLSGIPVGRYKMLTYLLSGFFAAIAGIVLTGRTGAAQATAATGMELQAIGAVILGGVALTGGSGSTRNIVYGVALLGVLSNAMNLAGISSYMQQILLGLVIIGAAVLDKYRRRQA